MPGRQAFDDLIQSRQRRGGLAALVDPDAALQFVPSIIADKTCGLFAAIACLAALRHKETDRRGAVCLRADAGDLHRLHHGRAPLRRDLYPGDRQVRPHHHDHPLSQAVEDQGRLADGDAGQPGPGGQVHRAGRHPGRLRERAVPLHQGRAGAGGGLQRDAGGGDGDAHHRRVDGTLRDPLRARDGRATRRAMCSTTRSSRTLFEERGTRARAAIAP